MPPTPYNTFVCHLPHQDSLSQLGQIVASTNPALSSSALLLDLFRANLCFSPKSHRKVNAMNSQCKKMVDSGVHVVGGHVRGSSHTSHIRNFLQGLSWKQAQKPWLFTLFDNALLHEIFWQENNWWQSHSQGLLYWTHDSQNARGKVGLKCSIDMKGFLAVFFFKILFIFAFN